MTQDAAKTSNTPRINVPFGVFLAGAGLFVGQFVAHLLIYSTPGRAVPFHPLRFFAEPGGTAFVIFVIAAIWFGAVFRSRRDQQLPVRPRGGVLFATSLLSVPVLTLGPALAMAVQETQYFGAALFLYSLVTIPVSLGTTAVITTVGFLLLRRWAQKRPTSHAS